MIKNQQGITTVFILIALAVFIGVSAVTYGYFIIASPNQPNKQTIELPPAYLIPSPLPEAIEKLGEPGCPDTDYTGCDTSSQWMSWDGQVNQEAGTSTEGTIFSK